MARKTTNKKRQKSKRKRDHGDLETDQSGNASAASADEPQNTRKRQRKLSKQTALDRVRAERQQVRSYLDYNLDLLKRSNKAPPKAEAIKSRAINELYAKLGMSRKTQRAWKGDKKKGKKKSKRRRKRQEAEQSAFDDLMDFDFDIDELDGVAL